MKKIYNGWCFNCLNLQNIINILASIIEYFLKKIKVYQDLLIVIN